MKFMVSIPLRGLRATYRGRVSTHYSAVLPAVRLIRPEHFNGTQCDYIWVDVTPPDEILHILSRVGLKADGSYRCSINPNLYRKTLGPFIESGDAEWDVRGMS
ncbi:hypothetical protein [Burkholderia oklahomensis]|uniref:hypothetical protein n=1 Tax=Burkholderia oklahomensis TaxID=342113 RepID=UPI000F53A981|nr:hypothetical protein [Burkholderia oklahomensis]MBI0361027.1 hypothetical protein [Burkholderia oklahomensis]